MKRQQKSPTNRNPQTPKPKLSKTDKFPLSLILASNLNTWHLHKLASLSSLSISYWKSRDYIAHPHQRKLHRAEIWCRSCVSVPVTYKTRYYITYKNNFTGVQTSTGTKHLKPTVFRIENAFQMNLKMFIFWNIQLSHSN